MKELSVEEVWEQLSYVPVNEEGEIDEKFLHFPTRTDREEIWLWIETEYDISVHSLMFT